jgi:two-component system, sensor histidine kinase and response regulator
MPADRPAVTETILVVDDNLQNRLVVEGHLVAAGYRVIQAQNGKEAVKIFASDPVDLVLLDVEMPVMDGFEACRRIRAMDRGSEVPIVFITAHRDLRTHEKAMESAADDFLSKPIQRVELLLRAMSLLRIKRLRDELVCSNVFIASQRDALLRAQAEKRRLSAMIVHDLRGPLGCVLGNADYVQDSASLTECVRQAVLDIHTSADTMDRMLNDLLDVARSEDGALTPNLKPVNVMDLLDEVRSYLRGRERNSQHRIILDIRPELGPVQADRDLLRRVIENLVENSTKYAPAGTDVRLEVSLEEGGRLLFKVRDLGPGVPFEYRSKVFDQYVQLDRDRQRHARGGRGVGLAFCRLAVEAHGGEIWVEDNLPIGSAFCFRIPGAADERMALAASGAGTEAA